MATAELIRSGGASAAEVATAARDRIDRLNPLINAVVIPLELEPLPVARDRPFVGVPTLLKDLGACLTGVPLYQGSQLLRRLDWRALDDAPLARRLRDAGFSILGKTNTPEFGAGVATHPKSFGPTRNPWNLDYSTSGSSGGAAAAVAAGLVPIAHGTDFAGSIRLPAAWCRVIGLKPSRGRVDRRPTPPGATAEFFLTRSLRDAAAMLDLVADHHPDAPHSRPARGWLATHTTPPRPCRVGLITEVAGVETDPVVRSAAVTAAKVLERAGHDVVPLDDTFLSDDDWEPMQLIIRARGAKARLDALAEIAGHPLGAEDAEPLMRALASLSPTFTEDEVKAAGEWQLRFAAQLTGRWIDAGVDAAITPTTGITARPLETMRPTDDVVRTYATYRQVGCFAGCWNMTGHTAISLPWWDGAGLPLGVQLVAAAGSDELLLQLAHQLATMSPAETTVRAAAL